MEKPIIFTMESVRAILDGKKTQTRRVIKPQPYLRDTTNIRREPIKYWAWLKGEEYETWPEHVKVQALAPHCPYGQAGDRLWVKEVWCANKAWNNLKPNQLRPVVDQIWYSPFEYSRELHGKHRSSRFMMKWMSRITLEITGVRVERLQEIGVEDAIAEGCIPELEGRTFRPAIGLFRELWDSLNAKRGYGWDTNLWVWVISFKPD